MGCIWLGSSDLSCGPRRGDGTSSSWGVSGGEGAFSRRRKRMTQQALGERADLGQSTISRLERGQGGQLSLDAWQRVALALDRSLRVELNRDPNEEPADAGHLAIQELVLGLGRAAGHRRSFELPTRPADPSRSVDVGLRDDARRWLLLIEAVNTIGDIGASVRSSSRKLAEAEALAATLADGSGYTVFSCWVVRATARNRALLGRYPEVFAARFPGSSVRWVQALTAGRQPPAEPGLVWCDVSSTRVFPWRRR